MANLSLSGGGSCPDLSSIECDSAFNRVGIVQVTFDFSIYKGPGLAYGLLFSVGLIVFLGLVLVGICPMWQYRKAREYRLQIQRKIRNRKKNAYESTIDEKVDQADAGLCCRIWKCKKSSEDEYQKQLDEFHLTDENRTLYDSVDFGIPSGYKHWFCAPWRHINIRIAINMLGIKYNFATNEILVKITELLKLVMLLSLLTNTSQFVQYTCERPTDLLVALAPKIALGVFGSRSATDLGCSNSYKATFIWPNLVVPAASNNSTSVVYNTTLVRYYNTLCDYQAYIPTEIVYLYVLFVIFEFSQLLFLMVVQNHLKSDPRGILVKGPQKDRTPSTVGYKSAESKVAEEDLYGSSYIWFVAILYVLSSVLIGYFATHGNYIINHMDMKCSRTADISGLFFFFYFCNIFLAALLMLRFIIPVGSEANLTLEDIARKIEKKNEKEFRSCQTQTTETVVDDDCLY